MGCSKDEAVIDTQQEIEIKLPNNERFKSFVGILKTGENIRKGVGMRTNDPVSVSETIWGVEAALNIFYTRRGIDVEKTDAREITLPIDLNNGLVNAVDVYDAYVAMWTEIVSHYDAYQGDDKAFVLADLSLDSIDNNHAILKLTTVMGDVYEMVNPWGVNCNVFKPGDNWKPGGYYLGHCDNDDYPWEAADSQIESKVNYYYKRQHLLTPPSETPCQNGFINLEYFEAEASDYPNPNWQLGDDPQREHLLWLEESDEIGNTCIGYENMNWYYCNMTDIIENETPVGKSFIDLRLATGCLSCNGCTVFCQFLADVRYGEPVWIVGDCPINPYEPPTLDPAKDYLQP